MIRSDSQKINIPIEINRDLLEILVLRFPRAISRVNVINSIYNNIPIFIILLLILILKILYNKMFNIIKAIKINI
jgi:hypothetical protein